MGNLKVGDTDFPFDLTARGRLNLEESKVVLAKVATSEQEALRFAWEVLKGACIFNEMEFKIDFKAFVNKVEADVFAKARTMAVELIEKARAEKSVATVSSPKEDKKQTKK